MDSQSGTTKYRFLTFVLKAGLLNAALASVLSALIIETLYMVVEYRRIEGVELPGFLGFLCTVVLLLPITMVSCGSFGFLAGAAGAFWMHARRKKIKTVRRLRVESTVLGALAGVAFPFFDRGMNELLAAGGGGGFTPIIHLFTIPAGVTCSLITAAWFQGRFVQDPLKAQNS
ncbi:MAG: hypothetical protein HYX26_07145 [Acidobacteriales bacterium]|nr:hypothetical protein [Terriglobales bacterium]